MVPVRKKTPSPPQIETCPPQPSLPPPPPFSHLTKLLLLSHIWERRVSEGRVSKTPPPPSDYDAAERQADEERGRKKPIRLQISLRGREDEEGFHPRVF